MEVWLIEVFGGVAPATRAHLRRLARRANKKGARDATKYGETRLSTRSYYTHHVPPGGAAARTGARRGAFGVR